MSLTTTKVAMLVDRLLRVEGAVHKKAPVPSPAFHVCEKFRNVLSTLLGPAGFHALLLRSVTLAQNQAPALKAVTVKPDGTLDGLPRRGRASGGSAVEKGESILVAQLVGLLVVFIGEGLTLQLVQDAWPEVNLDDFIA